MRPASSPTKPEVMTTVTSPWRIGATVSAKTAIDDAADRDADLAQIFISSSRQWRAPKHREDLEPLAAKLPLYVHVPYLVNPVSGTPETRQKSTELLAATMAESGRLGALGVIVHGGQATAGDLADPLDGWRRTAQDLPRNVRLLVENTAGGPNAQTKTPEGLARVVDVLADAGIDVGTCLDTCHAWASDYDIDQFVSVTGKPDLIHVNGSKDPRGSGRDRHENLHAGEIDFDYHVEQIRAAGPQDICIETPNGMEAHRDDIRMLKDALQD